MFSNLYTLHYRYCLQLLQILIVSLLMLHINIVGIVGVVTCSANSTRRLVTCIIGSFFNSFYYHITQFHCCNVSITIQEKTKIEQNAINFCHVLQFHVLQFHVLQVSPSFSCPSFSAPPSGSGTFWQSTV